MTPLRSSLAARMLRAVVGTVVVGTLPAQTMLVTKPASGDVELVSCSSVSVAGRGSGIAFAKSIPQSVHDARERIRDRGDRT